MPVTTAPALADDNAEAARGWPLWQRVTVRYLTLHWLLYAFPKPLDNLWQTFFGTLARLWPDPTLPGWSIRANVTISEWTAKPKQWWESALTWLEGHDLTFGAEMIHTATIQSDTCAAWTRVAYIGIASALLTLVWSLLDRRAGGHPRLGRWLHLGARWYLALAMLAYAWPKFVGGQFPPPTIERLTSDVGDLTPSGVLWTFMGQSQVYTWFAGLGELLGFLLLLHRRTALLGAVVTAGVMANVCAFNWLYGVPLKQYSSHLFLIALFLLAPFRHRLWALFVSNGNAAPVDLRVVKTAWLGWPLALIGWFWAIGACVNAGMGNIEWRERASTTTHAMPELFGLWTVSFMTLGGEPVQAGDPGRWRDLAIDRGNTLRIRTGKRPLRFDYAEDLTANTVTLTPKPPPGEPMTWQLERSKIAGKAPNPAPRRPEDFRTPIDVERDAITLRGEWDGQPLEVLAVKKSFNVDRPFRLITEWPR